ncbi:lipothrixviral structural protein [Sulfolobus islandicus filamentous virus 2]|uniref:Lipothrixviral structural protein n=1 Tax=Sulfolobus islandicus filamentous virus 2 TaxID=1902331 RepID=A0A1D8BJ97_SIFV|nr:lipothrixviral structural protein [Sulfolobus islandicus filamentous virus 2]
MPQWNLATFVKLLDYAKKNGIVKRYNTYYIKGVALVQCNQVSINVTVAKDHLHMFYDPVMNMYFAYSMPFFYQYPNAQQLFTEGKKLCEELEKLTPSATLTPPKSADLDLDRILAKLSITNDKVLTKGEEYKKAKEYTRTHYPECYAIVKEMGANKDTVKLIEAIFAREWETAERTLTLIAMDCVEPECISRLGKFIDLCRETISRREVR